MAKVVLCRCEDVTLHDVEHAVAKGYAHLEEVKRYTGFGTGPCQGKECLGPVALALVRITGVAPHTIAPFTSRPPLEPTPFRLLASDPIAHRFADDGGARMPTRSLDASAEGVATYGDDDEAT